MLCSTIIYPIQLSWICIYLKESIQGICKCLTYRFEDNIVWEPGLREVAFLKIWYSASEVFVHLPCPSSNLVYKSLESTLAQMLLPSMQADSPAQTLRCQLGSSNNQQTWCTESSPCGLCYQGSANSIPDLWWDLPICTRCLHQKLYTQQKYYTLSKKSSWILIKVQFSQKNASY